MKTVRFHQRARQAAASAHPGLWRDMELFLAPAMGCQGFRLIDCSPRNYSCNMAGTPPNNWWAGHGPLGKGCSIVNALGNYVECGTAFGEDAIICDGEMTIAMYLKIDSYVPATECYLAGCRDNPTSHAADFQLTYGYSAYNLAFYWSDYGICTSGLEVVAGTWYSIAVRRWGVPGGWYVGFWVNGRRGSVYGPLTIDPGGAPNPFLLFGGPTRPSPNCRFATVGLWNRSLYPAEIRALHADPLAPIRPGPEKPLMDAEWTFPFETCSEVID